LKVEGAYSFKAGKEKVWAALLSPDVLSSCIPGCQEFKPTGEDAYDVVLKVGVAAISGTYTGRVTLTEKKPHDSYRMLVEGKGSGGTIKGEGFLSFAEGDGQTEVKVEGDAQVTGVVARVGQRLLGSAARMLMNQFFGCLKDKVEGT
jgi:carbon monoxide dehydrogenase subunit G